MARYALSWLGLALVWLCLTAGRPNVSAQAEDDSIVAGDDALVERIKKAIAGGVRFLRSQQRADGSWDGLMTGQNNGGWTALSCLALLTAGVSADDPAIQKGLTVLKGLKTTRTYVVALRLMVFAQAAPKEVEFMKADVQYLEQSLMPDGWSYYKLADLSQKGVADNSNTQYALLGLYEARRAKVPVSDATLKILQKLYKETQNRDGGWAYKPSSRGGSTLTMTTAGICNLLITGEELAKGKAVLRPDGSAERCGEYEDNEHLSRALAWLGDRFPARITPTVAEDRLGSPFYALYGLERAGRLTGQRYFGGHDWYEVGVRYLVETQKADGSWAGVPGRGTLDHPPVVATSFALLFLAKGRVPVLLTKLAYGELDGYGWNNKRNDMRNLSDFCSEALFKNQPVGWQVFDIRTIEAPGLPARQRLAAQLLQSPLVFFNGHTLAPRNKEAEVLREYVNNGGFLFAENCCGVARFPKFEEDLKRLVRELFQGEAKLEPLEKEHPIWTASGLFASSPRDFPLLGIKQGCKTVMIYSPVPLSGYWETNDRSSPQAKRAFEMGANIVAYATGLEAPRPRLARTEIPRSDLREPIKRGYLQVAQLRHEGEWQSAPKAMRNLMLEARKAGLDVILKTEPLFPSDAAVLEHRFLYMHGRGDFKAKRVDLKHLRFCLRSGGLLLADACCGSAKFDAAFRAFVEELFGDEKLKLEPLPLEDPLYSAALNGSAIKSIKRRPATGAKRDYVSAPPALEGVRYKGRWVILYSKVDLGCALERHTSPECFSHDYESAARLGRAVILYALTR